MAQEDRSKDFTIVNIKALARAADIPYSKFRNCIVGTYSSLSEEEKTRLFNEMQEGVTHAAAFLGFTYEGKRIKPKG